MFRVGRPTTPVEQRSL